jgi:hypothetical protein
MLSISVIALWKANNKIYTPYEFYFAPTRIVTLEEVRNLCSSLWIAADHSSLKCSQNTHTSFKSSEINAKRSATSSSLTPPIFVFKFFSHNTQSPIQVSALFTPAHHTKLTNDQERERFPPHVLPKPATSAHATPMRASFQQ